MELDIKVKVVDGGVEITVGNDVGGVSKKFSALELAIVLKPALQQIENILQWIDANA